MQRLLIIDGSSMLVTAFYGNAPAGMKMAKTPEEKERFYPMLLQTKNGVFTNAVYTLLSMVIKIIRIQRPSHIAFVFDESREELKRKQVFPGYKANRGDFPAPLSQQFETAKTALSNMGFFVISRRGVEADDLAGSMVDMFEKEIPISLLTKDADYLQMVSPYVTVWKMQTDKQKANELRGQYELVDNVPGNCFEYNEYLVLREMGIMPKQIPDLKGLAGDTSDNIPGVRGISEKTATALLQEYGTIEKLYEAVHSTDAEELKKRWKEIGISRPPLSALLCEQDQKTGLSGEETALLSKKLATVEREPIRIKLRNGQERLLEIPILRTPMLNTQRTAEVFRSLEIEKIDVTGI